MNNNQPEGNYYNKYEQQNGIINWIVMGYFNHLDNHLGRIGYSSVYEAGCGEGYISQHIYEYNQKKQQSARITASDLSEHVILQAKQNFLEIEFKVESIYNIGEKDNSHDLIIACEVLEHLENPRDALKELFRVAGQYVLISVPNEPMWRIANFFRGKYLRSLGNTPGHINHWSKKNIIQLVSEYGDLLQVSSPFPWTMLLCRKKY